MCSVIDNTGTLKMTVGSVVIYAAKNICTVSEDGTNVSVRYSPTQQFEYLATAFTAPSGTAASIAAAIAAMINNIGAVSLTYAQILVLISDGGLDPGATYFISDKNIYLRAVSTTEFESHGTYKAYNVDWQNTSGNFLGVWSASLAGVALSKLCAWNGFHYQNITGSNGASNPTIDTTNWLLLAKVDGNSYVIEYDFIVYDFSAASIRCRIDKRKNIVFMTNTELFQWGRTSTANNIVNGVANIVNAELAQSNMVIEAGSELTVTATALARNVTMYSTSEVIISGAADVRYSNFHSSSLYATGGTAIHCMFEQYGSLTMVAGTFADYLSLSYCTITLDAADLRGSKIDCRGTTGGITKTFTGETHVNKTFIYGVSSNFISAITITNATTTLTLDVSPVYGIYNVTCTGGVATIDTIANLSSAVKSVMITAANTNNITFVHDPAKIRLKGAANKTINTTNKDWIEFGIYNGAVIQEYNSGIY